MAEFNEKTRVQIPALVHLLRLGYKYLGRNSDSTKSFKYDATTNIAVDIFKEKFFQLNPSFKGDFNEVLREINHDLNNDDLGMSFYNRLISHNQKLIDFENINNNSFHFTGEFPYRNEGEEFRPDITLFINGLPLVFIEVKTPNNPGGIVAEAERMNNKRLPNPKFRRYINITQLMIFSNNMEYDNVDGIAPVEGAFYSTAAKQKAFFNCFREDSDKFITSYPYKPIDMGIEKQIIGDFNAHTLPSTPEYKTNLDFNTPTNRIITSLCSWERLLFIIKYGVAYLNYNKEIDGNIKQFNLKHIMRYQQLLATLAVGNTLKEGKKSGIIWHTQGSGKTALSYYLIKYLTDYFSSQNKVAKFYFIVDRLDLLEQAKQEFEYRGLSVKTPNNKQELMTQFQTTHATEGNDGKMEITVVNIQRFDEKDKINIADYSVNLQRIFIIDEAHRSYKKGGSFLANLFNADTNSIKIALTGTPLLRKDKESWSIFGNYIHTYYYDKSIKDGYTLKIIREDVETSCKLKLEEIHDSLQQLAQKNDVKMSNIIEHDSYVEELTKFIIKDFKQFQNSRESNSLGGMVICETSNQAKKIYKFFNKIQSNMDDNEFEKTNLKAALILHDTEDKATRMKHINDFKKGKNIDILIVYNMLLTGFDAPRLKKIYFGRKLTDHTLLQAITRVNRPYKESTYGYIIDFADIKKNFNETNEAYLRELQKINEPSDAETYDVLNSIFEDKDKLIDNVKKASNELFKYTINNLEIFNSEISEIDDKKHLIELRNVLFSARDSFNLVRTWGDVDLKEKFNEIKIENLPILINLLTKRINIVNQKLALKDNESFKSSINEIMNNIEFIFKKTSLNDELKIVSTDILNEKWVQISREFEANIDTKDPEYSSLISIIRAKFAQRGFNIHNMDEFDESSTFLEETLSNIKKINKDNNNLLAKYDNDQKFVRIHKRILELNKKHADEKYELILSNDYREIMNVLKMIKNNIDNEIYKKDSIVNHQSYFKRTISSTIYNIFEEKKIEMNNENIEFIIHNVEEEYTSQIKQ
ncbi:Type I restriction modification system endonuclease subunit HsdR [Mycoplasmopsis californica]|uniref:type I site-specific deoxyribonuclease n=1 Tax=Mycoplasmopsis californica TaxID=2113 RepID=A0A059XVS0_9BACT|nr:type I restriction endonuclease [Mycoplasmopsis californica]AIA29322.1 Type I restriction modification system endonuclease subunit HsdR [Mycoplasmopsis californica]